ncbi:unnamed protein product [Fraxinus pennsylvanica]|uniref:Uncharacterized protein n=1 Tax=Fraxinus pennsylvanica TaxID=56036 RepID=A0AAD2A433_9LAMI|nr:unnamed protein product [Fraxinus pennsylvanica]
MTAGWLLEWQSGCVAVEDCRGGLLDGVEKIRSWTVWVEVRRGTDDDCGFPVTGSGVRIMVMDKVVKEIIGYAIAINVSVAFDLNQPLLKKGNVRNIWCNSIKGNDISCLEVDWVMAEADAKSLYKGGEKMLGTDEKIFIHIFSERSRPQ